MRFGLGLKTTVAASALLAGTAQAQTPAAATAADPDLGTIIVTAQKSGSESLAKVPITISVLEGARLDAAGSSSVNDAISRLPGVAVYNSFQGGGSKFAVRGVASNPSIFSGASTVAYYLDDVAFAFVKMPLTPDANAYDLDRVEVLKGPQGTLYGASALAGVIRVLTHDAQTDKLQVKGQGGLSFTDGGGTNYRGDAAINIPLVEDKLAVRAIVSYDDESGWVDRPLINQKNYNGSRNETYRLKVTATPTERLSIKLGTWISRKRHDGTDGGYADQTMPTILDESTIANYETYDARLSYAFDDFQVESSTSYINYKNDGTFQLSAAEVERSLFKAQTFNQEVHAYSTGAGPWKWSLGAAYRNSQDDRRLNAPITFRADLVDTNRSKSIAVFAELARMFFDGTVEVRGGLRYFNDDVSYSASSNTTGALAQPASSAATFKKVTPRAVISWFPSSRHTLYASYSQGFRSGFNQGIDSTTAAPGLGPVRPDLLTNYETGAKGAFGALRYEVSVYYQNWKRPQVTQFVNIGSLASPVYISTPTNGTRADGIGADASASLRVARGLVFGGSLSWNDLSFSEDVFLRGIKIYSKGDRLDDSAAFTGSLYGEYGFDLGSSGLSGQLVVNASHVSRITQRNGGTAALFVGDDVNLISSSFTISSPHGWSAKAFVENAGNWYGIVRPTTSVRQYLVSRIRPRTIGVSLSYKY